jgi:hypothetical protein
VPESVATTCPNCGAAASGNFCGKCGAALGPRHCPACGTSAAPQARFCRGCGAPLAGSAAAREPKVPWIVAGVLCFVAVAAVVYSAGKRGQADAPAMANAGNATGVPQPSLGPAPDISNMTPREQFARLNDRVMAAAEAGDSTTVITFWPMAAGAYENLLPGDRDIDARYHMATLHLLLGQFPAALALADTIMAEAPDNLLGWYVRGVVAEFQADGGALASAQQGFNRAFDREMASGREEYTHHADMLRQYRSTPGAN